MSTECTHQTKEQIAAFLPGALKKAINSYEIYYAAIDHGEADNFAEYHKNAKVALAHIDLLMKLAKWADLTVDTRQQSWHVLSSDALEETNAYHSKDTNET